MSDVDNRNILRRRGRGHNVQTREQRRAIRMAGSLIFWNAMSYCRRLSFGDCCWGLRLRTGAIAAAEKMKMVAQSEMRTDPRGVKGVVIGTVIVTEYNPWTLENPTPLRFVSVFWGGYGRSRDRPHFAGEFAGSREDV